MAQVAKGPAARYDGAREPIPPWPGRVVDMAPGKLYVRRAPAVDGTGPDGSPVPAATAEPALFIHGLGGSSTNWTDLMDLLSRPGTARPGAPALDCTAVDLPGFGYSPPPADDDYTVSGHARAVIDLIDGLGTWPVHLVGNSMGGAVATRVAARRPDLVRTLALVSPALPDLRPRPLPLRLALATAPGAGQAIMSWLRHLPAERRTDQTVRDLFADPARLHPARREQEIAELRRRDALPYADRALMLSARSLVAEYFRTGPGSLWRDAARVRVPVLVLHGSQDRLVNPATAAKAARSFRLARVVVLPGVGHVAMMERPALVAGELREFYEWVRAGCRPVTVADPA